VIVDERWRRAAAPAVATSPLTRRVNLLLTRRQWQGLRARAAAEGRTLPQVVRWILADQLARREAAD